MHFQDFFHNRISQLVYTFPEDAKTSQGANFWSAPKRFPSALNFDAKDPLHLQCMRAGANLKAQVHGIMVPETTDDDLVALCDKVHVEKFTPKAGVTIETDPKVVLFWHSAFITCDCQVFWIVDIQLIGFPAYTKVFQVTPVASLELRD